MAVADLKSQTLSPRLARADVVVSPSIPAPQPNTRRRRARTAFVVFALFVVLLNFVFGFASELNPRLRDPAYGDKLAKLHTKTPDVLMLGSSRTLLGFHAGRVEETTGRTAFNFGTPATGPITHLVYLNRLLKAGVRPKLLLVEVLPPMMADGPGGPIEQAFLPGERLTAGELDIVERFGFDPAMVRPAWRESVAVPWWKLRFQVLGRLGPSWLPWHLRYDWSRTADACGWATPPRQETTGEERVEQLAKVRAEYAGTLAAMDPDGRPLAALRELVAVCRANDVPVSLVLMPEADTFRGLYPPGLDDRAARCVRSLGAPVVDARRWLDEGDFYDGHHPFTRGAEKFTDRLMREVIP
jgi:hypothetical protein